MRTLFAVTGIAAALIVATSAHAAGGHGSGGRGPGSMWMQLDSNQDGRIQRQEFDQHRKDLFNEADANADGKLNFEEMQALHEIRRKRRQEARFKRLDRDGDGAVSAAEMDRIADRMWIRMDRNDDDEVGRGEMRGRHGRRHYRR